MGSWWNESTMEEKRNVLLGSAKLSPEFPDHIDLLTFISPCQFSPIWKWHTVTVSLSQKIKKPQLNCGRFGSLIPAVFPKIWGARKANVAMLAAICNGHRAPADSAKRMVLIVTTCQGGKGTTMNVWNLYNIKHQIRVCQCEIIWEIPTAI